MRGRLLLAGGRFDEALLDAQEAAKLDPGSAEAQFLLGSVLEARKDLDGAAKAFAEVQRLNPRATSAQVQARDDRAPAQLAAGRGRSR